MFAEVSGFVGLRSLDLWVLKLQKSLPFSLSDKGKGNSGVLKEAGSKNRVRSESCSGSSSKAYREKMRRDKLNDKFMESGAILDPGRPPKTDKAAILIDVVRMVTQLRTESQKLKDTNSDLQDKIIQ